jgi:hypothetical protein
MDGDALGKGKSRGKKGEKGEKGKGKDDKGGYKVKDYKGGYEGYKGDQSSYQGAGKGKQGKGGKPEQFQCNCNFCGYWGLRADPCRRNPKNGASGKPVHQLGAEKENYHPVQASRSLASGTSATPIRALVQTGMPVPKTDWMMALNVAAVNASSDSKRARVMIDSGSSIMGCPLSFGSHVALEASENPLNLKAVSGANIVHHGSRSICDHVPTSEGDRCTCMNFEVCDIEGPISSAAKMNDNGFICVFPMTGDGPAVAVRDCVQILFSLEQRFPHGFCFDENLEQWNIAENTIARLVDNKELFAEMMQPFDEEDCNLPDIPLAVVAQG